MRISHSIISALAKNSSRTIPSVCGLNRNWGLALLKREISTNVGDIKAGMHVDVDGKLMRVMNVKTSMQGRGSATTQLDMKNFMTGHRAIQRYRSNDKVERAILDKVKYQYLYKSGNLLNLMDMNTFEQTEADAEVLGKKTLFLKDGEEYTFLAYKGELLDVNLPTRMVCVVTNTPEPAGSALRADGHSTKTATLDNGLTVRVPDFVKEGDQVSVVVETLEYGERVL